MHKEQHRPGASRALGAGLALALLLGAAAARAEGPVQALKLQASTQFARTQAAQVNAVADGQPQRYSLDQLNILRPVSVTLVAPPNSGLKLVLSKVAAEVLRQGVVGEPGYVNLKFRTEGGFYAAVQGTRGTPYRLLVLVGEEEQRKLPPIVVPATGLKPRADAAPPPWPEPAESDQGSLGAAARRPA